MRRPATASWSRPSRGPADLDWASKGGRRGPVVSQERFREHDGWADGRGGACIRAGTAGRQGRGEAGAALGARAADSRRSSRSRWSARTPSSPSASARRPSTATPAATASGRPWGSSLGVAILVGLLLESVVRRLLRRGRHVRLGRGLRAQPAPHGQGRLARPHPVAPRRTERRGRAGGGIEGAVHDARDWFRPPLPPRQLTCQLPAAGMGELCLAVDIGGTKLAVDWSTVAGQLHRAAARRRPPRTAGRRGAVGHAVRAGRAGAAGGRRRGRPAVCGVGCGGPMAPGARRCPRSTSPPGGASRSAAGWPS